MEPILQVRDLSVAFENGGKSRRVLYNVHYEAYPGEIVGIVGESGCGKSISLLTALQLQPAQGKVLSGEVLFHGQNLLAYARNGKEMQKIRGNQISMIFQNPMNSLNPVLTVGQQIGEALRCHKQLSQQQARQEAINLLRRVLIEQPEEKVDCYPYECSGGMCQRIMIAMAIACKPEVLIADEATTALDVTTQKAILELLKDLAKQENIAVIFVTHNLGIVAQYTSRIYVMYAGHIVEQAKVDALFFHPAHPYTQGLLFSVPKLSDEHRKPLYSIAGSPPDLTKPVTLCPFFERCGCPLDICRTQPPQEHCVAEGHTVSCHLTKLEKHKSELPYPDGADTQTGQVILQVRDLDYSVRQRHQGLFSKEKSHIILQDINFNLMAGETLGIVGESGCGKTTLARCILQLYTPTRGSVLYSGPDEIKDLTKLSVRALNAIRPDIQMVFQNSVGSLNPRMTIGQSLMEPLIMHHLTKGEKNCEQRAVELLHMVGLNEDCMPCFPYQLSGGQCQRVGIARALATAPKILICDEPVSALDVSVQASILNLLKQLQQKLGISYIFIAHDMSVVQHISDRILVMYRGRVVESGSYEEICSRPRHPYTVHLIDAIPVADPSVPCSPLRCAQTTAESETGCTYYPRCVNRKDDCLKFNYQQTELSPGHICSCLYPEPTYRKGEE